MEKVFTSGKIGLPAALLLLLAAAPSIQAAAAPSAEGLWQGLIFYQRAQVEVDITVELARSAKGEWVGTIDIPNQKLEYHPLENVQVNGRDVSFVLSRFSRHANATIVSPFQGKLAEDGKTIEGEFIEGGKNRMPFLLERRGAAGSERATPPAPPLNALSASGEELKAAFNRDADKSRLVLLLSPT
jgi:hypothetical protein